MNHITVYTSKRTNRLLYVLDWLIKEQLKLDYELVHDETTLSSLPFFISYGKNFPNALSIPDAGLLWEKGVNEHEIITGSWNEVPTLYEINAATQTLPFDFFSAIFFLLSRYEEYYTYAPDAHNRYPAIQSILYKNRWLQRPLLDEWMQTLRTLMKEQFNVLTPAVSFSYLPTYDIDIAYSYKYKGFVRIAGAQARDVWARNKQVYKERMSVVLNQKQDPYDSYDWIKQLHGNNGNRPVFFILSAQKTTGYDKNILPSHPKMQKLINDISRYGEIGLHPSYYSENYDTLKSEKETLEKIVHKNISISRQHYIKAKLPETYLRLLKTGISQDYSMGYGTHFGFRAGTGQSFLWYSLNNEFTTPLRIHPFCFMDTTAMFEEKLSLNDSFDCLKAMTRLLQKSNSRLCTIFHNFSLGTAPEWLWWKGAYKEFINELFTLK
jgi:hypothetical protein